ncbi:MAG: hypothetical protein II951_07875 [Bacteroidales bacterium]|nr:hypothetical protein [Bacteroidales bacterium]
MDYNAIYGSTDNRIELKDGVKAKEPLMLKVRVTRGWRKFFWHIIDQDGGLALKRDWTGDFGSVIDILVVEINKHDYKAV